MRDEIFKKKAQKQFEFDASVASVFDDMISRSVPFYRENLELGAGILAKILPENSSVFDLGCSSANFLLFLSSLRPDLKLFGVDNAPSMLEIARAKTSAFGAKISYINSSLNDFEIPNSRAFVANYTLQFIRPPKRQKLVDEIYKALEFGGIFLMSEKIIYEDAFLAKNMIEIYENYKQSRGYSRFEIASKREALENVLVPYSEKENLKMLENAGFSCIECIFKWANFQSFIALKDKK